MTSLTASPARSESRPPDAPAFSLSPLRASEKLPATWPELAIVTWPEVPDPGRTFRALKIAAPSREFELEKLPAVKLTLAEATWPVGWPAIA